MASPECENRSSSPLHDYPIWRPSITDNPFLAGSLDEQPPPNTTDAGSLDSLLLPMSYTRSSTIDGGGAMMYRTSPAWNIGPGLFPLPPSPMRFSASMAQHVTAPGQTSALPPPLPPFSHLDAAETLTGLAQKALPLDSSIVHSASSSVHDTPLDAMAMAGPSSNIRDTSRPNPPTLRLSIKPPIRTSSGGSGTTPPLSAAPTMSQSQSQSPSPKSPTSALRFDPLSSLMPRLPPILQVEKTVVTTTATQYASAQRRRNDAIFKCPVPGCGSTFTRRFNLRGHLRSHTEEKPYICAWPDCAKGFARQHDCKRHQALHTNQKNFLCHPCQKSFSRMDALNRHVRASTPCREKSGTTLSQPIKMEESDSSKTAGGPSEATVTGTRISSSSRASSEDSDAIGSPQPMDEMDLASPY
ncbi:hypothetical protein FRB94_001660 [Tulasnella sp. JGI-2019a]|nr:hypothetical protein FRB94_001660 [Tulasnella sp. JGI-2019a]KAG9010418.1 hypothetical protein FRB93_004258 [Tulasnella sp. JGI-2019a]KAG9038710.1 hypothetical protein FRB95_000300 [Tulasnella sp. JGI-2019a]